MSGGEPVPMGEVAKTHPRAEAFWSYVTRTDGCWLWQGARTSAGTGYGTFWDGTRTVLAHRFAYEQLVGPIQDGLELDHVRARGCATSMCVNPSHLEPVTHQENVRRGRAGEASGSAFGRTRGALRNAEKTHCPAGHAYDEANTHVYRGRRTCRRCHSVSAEASRLRRAGRGSK